MLQSLFAIVAMSILSLFVFQQQQSAIYVQRTMIKGAVAVMSNGVAVERLSEIQTMNYDQATRDYGVIDAPTRLSLRSDFGPSRDTPNDDIDDFDAAVKDIYRVIGTDTLTFRVESEVTYADESDPSSESKSSLPTKYKKVTVKVYSLDLAEADTVEISQSFSCKEACQWGGP